MVLLHGFTQNTRCWGPIIDELAVDYEVVAIDAPGHGGSSSIQADLPTAARLVGAVGGRGTYVGYSMGGRILLHLALQNPQLVEKLVLIGTSAGIVDSAERHERLQQDRALAHHITSIGIAAFIDEWLSKPLFDGLDPVAAARDQRLTNSADAIAASLEVAGVGTQVPLWDQLATLAMPVLAITGSRDEKFKPLTQRLVDEIGENATFAEIPNAGHTAHLENPTEFIAILRSWLINTT